MSSSTHTLSGRLCGLLTWLHLSHPWTEIVYVLHLHRWTLIEGLMVLIVDLPTSKRFQLVLDLHNLILQHLLLVRYGGTDSCCWSFLIGEISILSSFATGNSLLHRLFDWLKLSEGYVVDVAAQPVVLVNYALVGPFGGGWSFRWRAFLTFAKVWLVFRMLSLIWP